MKVAYASDLHLEHKPLKLDNTVNADVLVLAGDICVAESIRRFPFYDNDRGTGSIHEYNSQSYQKFFENVAEQFKHVIYIAGNHEHYQGTYSKNLAALRENMKAVSDNIHFLDADAIDIGGVRFIGGTLWTNFARGNEYSMFSAEQGMNDFRIITYDRNGDYRKFRARDSIFEHQKYVDYIKILSYDHDLVVVVSHHAPTYLSIAPHYVGDSLNDAYASDLSDVILYREGILKWIHGHVHHTFDYSVGQCQVLCNPRGYPGEMPREFELMTFEV